MVKRSPADWAVVLGWSIALLAACLALRLVACTPAQRATETRDLDTLCALRAAERDGGAVVLLITNGCARGSSTPLIECTGEAGAAP